MSTTTTQPTQIPFAPIREKLREAIEQYKQNHPENSYEYQEFSKLFDAFESKEIFKIQNINETFEKQGYENMSCGSLTLLQLAVLLDSIELVQDILKYGANVNIENQFGLQDSVLHSAAELGNAKIVQLLIDAGADIEKTNSDQQTALHSAVLGDHLEVVELLLKNNANANTQDRQGTSPLHYSAYQGNLRMSEMFVKHGVDINAKNCEGLTAIDCASTAHHSEIVEYFLNENKGIFARVCEFLVGKDQGGQEVESVPFGDDGENDSDN